MIRRFRSSSWFVIPLALALGFAATAEEPTGRKVGDLLGVEFEVDHKVEERARIGDEDARSSTSSRVLKLVYIDRIEALSEGRVQKVTRHFKRVEWREDGAPQRSALEGRTVLLTRTDRGEVRATWETGSALPGRELDVVEAGPWPDVDSDWGLAAGSREGSLEGAPCADWKAPEGTPSFVAAAVEGFGLPEITKGAWSITVADAEQSAGSTEGMVTLEGRERDEADEEASLIEIRETVKLSLERSVAESMPEGAPPPEPEPEGEDPEEEGTDGDEDGDEPLPDEDEPDPKPAPDDDDDGDDPPRPAPDEEEPEPEKDG